MTPRSVRVLFPLVLVVALGQQVAVDAHGEDVARDGVGTSPGTGEVDRVGSERSRTRREQAVDDARDGVGRTRREKAVEEKQRQQYTQALAALRAGDQTRFQKLRDGLNGYALQPYLDYEFLKDRIATTPASKLHDFLERNPEAVVSDQLRKKWLKLLTDRGDWNTFLAEFRVIETDNELNCERLMHHI